MIKPDQRQRIRRINQLYAAADVIVALRAERPDLVSHNQLDMARRLRDIAQQYEAKPLAPTYARVLRAHDEPERRPPRVAMSSRRSLKLSGKMREIPIAQREFDGEAEHEEGQAYGHDVPDGSD